MTSATGDRRADLDRADRRPLVRWDELLPTAVGSALAALLLSRLGVAGTIAGAACTPVIITVTSATISRQIDYARQRAAVFAPERHVAVWRRLAERLPRRRRLKAALATAGAAFAIVAVVITAAEALAGKPVSSWGHHGGSGYTFGGRGATAGSHRSGGATTRPAGTPTAPAGAPPATTSIPGHTTTGGAVHTGTSTTGTTRTATTRTATTRTGTGRSSSGHRSTRTTPSSGGAGTTHSSGGVAPTSTATTSTAPAPQTRSGATSAPSPRPR
jgi:hypothetical protein